MTTASFGRLLAERPTLTIIVAVVLLRLPSAFQSVIDWDESIYILVAREILNGYLPYTAVFDHKPIGLYYLFAGFLAVFGDDPFSVRLLGIAAVAGSCLLLRHLLVAHVGLLPRTALWIALVYAVATGGLGGAAVNTEILVNFLTLTWVVAILHGQRNASAGYFLLAGAAMGVSFQINYLTGLLIIGFSAGYAVVCVRQANDAAAALQRMVVDGLVAICGFLLAAFVLLSPLFLFGDPSTYFGLQHAYLFNYRPTVSTTQSLERLYETGQAFLPLVALFWFGWIIGGRRQANREAVRGGSKDMIAPIALGILLGSFAAVCASFRFYQHYFLFLLPPLFILCGAAIAKFPPRMLFYRFGVVLLMVASFNIGIRGFIEAGKGLAVASQMAFSATLPADKPRSLARTLRPLLGDEDTIYVACDQTIIYQLAGVSPPIQFAHFPHALMPSYADAFGVPVADRIDQILQKRPRAIVLGNFNRCRKVPEAVWSLLEEKIQLAGYEFYQDYRGGRLFLRPQTPIIQFSEGTR